MHILLIVFVLISISFFGAAKFEKKAEEFLPITIFSIVLVSYIFGFFDILKYNIYLILIGAALCYLFGIYYIVKRKSLKKFIKNFFTPGISFFLFSFFLLIIYSRGRYLSSWDEFSHWGAVVKSMYFNEELSVGTNSFLQFKSYLPGFSLFLYDIQLLLGAYVESYLIVASKIFYFGLMCYFLKSFSWSDYKKIVCILLVIVLTPLITNPSFYYTILIDPALGFLTGFLIIYVFLEKRFSFWFWINIIFGLLNLYLLKDVGKFFVFLVILLLIVKMSYEKYEKINLTTFAAVIKKNIFPFLILISLIFLVHYSWGYLLNVNNVNVSFSTPISLNVLFDVVFGMDKTYHLSVLLNYVDAFFNRELINVMSVSICSSHILLVMLIITYKSRKNELYFKSFMGLLTIYLLYHFGLMIMYMFKFSEYEAVKLASFSRYVNSFLLCILICCLVGGLVVLKSKRKFFITFIIVLTLSNSTLAETFISYYRKENTYISRLPYIQARNKIAGLINEKGKYVFVFQNTNGWEWQQFNYEMMDLSNGFNAGWSFGEKYGGSDVWTQNRTTEEFMDYALKNGFDYCYLFKIDENFIGKYKNCFDTLGKSREGALYKFDKIEGKYLYIGG